MAPNSKNQDNADYTHLTSKDTQKYRSLSRRDSVEFLQPAFASPLRKTSFNAATFNLVATIVGGGVLSLPLAFAKAGIVLGTFMMVFSAWITEFGLYMLCSCARRTGARSYNEIVRHAFGAPAEILMTVTLWFFLSGVLVAFNVLLRGIFAPIARDILDPFEFVDTRGKHFDSVVLLVILVLVSPLMLKKNLYALRNICYVGFCSVCLIVLSIAFRAYQRNMEPAQDIIHGKSVHPQVLYFTTNVDDMIFAFPIIVLSFLCAYNVVEVQANFKQPTLPRIRSVLRTSIASTFLLFEAFSLVGYFYAYNKCKGNIFLNFDPADPIIMLGRIGMGITLMFGTPVVTLPCREAFLSIMPQVQKYFAESMEESNICVDKAEGASLLQDVVSSTNHTYASVASFDVECNEEYGEEFDVSGEVDNIPTLSETIIHVTSTFVIGSSAFFAAVAAPGVAVVWSILGSSIAMIIGFIVPSACYLKIRGSKGSARRTSAWALLIFSTILAIVCTYQTIVDIMK